MCFKQAFHLYLYILAVCNILIEKKEHCQHVIQISFFSNFEKKWFFFQSLLVNNNYKNNNYNILILLLTSVKYFNWHILRIWIDKLRGILLYVFVLRNDISSKPSCTTHYLYLQLKLQNLKHVSVLVDFAVHAMAKAGI